MKKIYFTLLALMALCSTFSACSEEEPFSTATANDEPRILDPIFPDRSNGALATFASFYRDGKLDMKLTVTPADYTTVSWYIDGEMVHEGLEIEQELKAGIYNLKVVAATADKSTYREGLVEVKPLAEDPYSKEEGYERIIAPGAEAHLYGVNLDRVKGIQIDGNQITDLSHEDGAIAYVVPAGLNEGVHRVVLVDADGNEFGANTVTVSGEALIVAGADRTNADCEWVMTGINLDKIAKVSFNGQEISDFTVQSKTEIGFICPSLGDGEYALSGKTKDGADVKFYTAEGMIAEKTVIVSSEITLWNGHHYVSWDMPDDSPNKTFNFIGADVFASIKPGTVMKIYYSLASEAEYHQMQTTTGWWSMLPGTDKIDLTADGVNEVVITQDVLNQIQEQSGFLIVGHGFYVNRVSIQ